MPQTKNARRNVVGGVDRVMSSTVSGSRDNTTELVKKQQFDLVLSLRIDALVAEEDALLERIEAGPVRRNVYQELARLRGERARVESLMFGGLN